jgi:lipopolysaccharide/colanic/teichoic acid biosynthesis glycosyltransferase
MIRRVIELVASVVLFAVCIPLILLIATAIRIDSPGPALFQQLRVGRGGRRFRFYKFRTMYVDAQQRYPDLYRYQYDSDAIRTMRFKLIVDPRLTRLGRRLRRTSLDELPNLINLFRGDVALVGPRPEIPEMLPYYEPWQQLKFDVKPGLTGLAQISGRGLLTLQETIAEDVRYVLERNLRLDLHIALQTVKVIIRRQGAF